MLLYHDCYYLSHSKHEQANEARKIAHSQPLPLVTITLYGISW